ncbi:ParA family protein [Leptothoe sp. PORK10 BA2]|uniref:ParA family protein n=1 Tax=Leptothoe sp. PORK10 BA2 TaxID=3110254 RepID=UPI002B2149F6|nr:ParA family protein [Leptothoe sp. PORK10 BA2]MEA5466972.1 ParA family protein [Leptothoe sp. PORK10 BA2]
MSIIAVSNFKGGVGKTTAAVCIATLLSDNANVLLIDADQNQSALLWSNSDRLPFKVLTEKASRKAMVGGSYQHIIIDSQCAPGTGESKALAEGSDLLIVPTTPDGPSLAATGRMFSELEEIENAIALISMVPPSPQKDGAEAAEALNRAGIPYFNRQIRNGKVYKRAFESGLTLPQMGSRDRAGQLWRDWIELKSEIEEVLSNE